MTFKVNNVYTYGSATFYFSADSGNLATMYVILNGRVTPVNHRFIQQRGDVIASADSVYKIVGTVAELLLGSEQQTAVETVRPGKEDKKNPVEVIRFLRPYAFHENMFGVTFIFTLDYHKRRIDVQLSVCNGDNFSRKEGVNEARKNKNTITGIYMPDDIYHSNGTDGLVTWFVTRVPDETRGDKNVKFNVHYNTIRLVTSMYENSHHNKEFMQAIEAVNAHRDEIMNMDEQTFLNFVKTLVG